MLVCGCEAVDDIGIVQADDEIAVDIECDAAGNLARQRDEYAALAGTPICIDGDPRDQPGSGLDNIERPAALPLA